MVISIPGSLYSLFTCRLLAVTLSTHITVISTSGQIMTVVHIKFLISTHPMTHLPILIHYQQKNQIIGCVFSAINVLLTITLTILG